MYVCIMDTNIQRTNTNELTNNKSLRRCPKGEGSLLIRLDFTHVCYV